MQIELPPAVGKVFYLQLPLSHPPECSPGTLRSGRKKGCTGGSHTQTGQSHPGQDIGSSFPWAFTAIDQHVTTDSDGRVPGSSLQSLSNVRRPQSSFRRKPSPQPRLKEVEHLLCPRCSKGSGSRLTVFIVITSLVFVCVTASVLLSLYP